MSLYNCSSDLKNWVVLHDKVEAAVDDVWEFGKVIGFNYKGEKNLVIKATSEVEERGRKEDDHEARGRRGGEGIWMLRMVGIWKYEGVISVQ